MRVKPKIFVNFSLSASHFYCNLHFDDDGMMFWVNGEDDEFSKVFPFADASQLGCVTFFK